jgi:hypothetical protein
MDYIQRETFGNNIRSIESSTSDKKWFVTSYTGISSGFNFFNGANATVLAVPIGLQLNRRLNNNLYAFTGVSLAPAYTNFNRSFLSSDFNKYPNNGLFRPNSFDMYARAEMGLMYVNDARTFSFSGSIGVERTTYQMLPYPQRAPANTKQPTSPGR